jgi:hypothetical protein
MSQQHVDQLRAETRQATIAELQNEIARLPDAARNVVMAALARTTKELTP